MTIKTMQDLFVHMLSDIYSAEKQMSKALPRLAKAVVDRLTHRAHIIDTGTESWRFRHGLANKKP